MITKIMFILLLIFLSVNTYAQKPVDVYGQLRVQGRYLVDKNGTPVVLRGMSLFWSQWGSKYWNSSVIDWVATDWRVNVIRAAMGVESGGYLTDQTTHKNLVKTVVQACINRGIYVIIDWHDHNAPSHQTEAINFFREMAQTYGTYPNVIYEIFNEPDGDDTWSGIKNYSQAVISAIRQYDSDNVILVGTPNWCQDVDVASQSPLTGVTNVMYVLHFYAASHTSFYRNKAQVAINNNLPIFVSEFGTCEYTGDGAYNFAETDTWINFLEQNKISWVNWSLNDKAESCSALVPGASTSGGWQESQLTQSGVYIRNKIRSYNQSSGGIVAYLASCSSGSIVWATTNVVVNVTAGSSVSKVEFYIDGTLKYTDTSSPYIYNWNTTEVTDGWHNVRVVAYDTQNNTSQVLTSVIVYNLTAPSVNILNPKEGAIIYGDMYLVSAEANKGYEQTINKVELYINNSKIAEDSTLPYSFTLNTTQYSDGNYTIRVIAYDKKGQQASSQVNIQIKNTDDPPSVSIISPQNGQTVGGTVTIQAQASDDRGISKVEFFINEEKKHTDGGSPYSWNWDTTQYSEGQHTIKVIAYDTSNKTAQYVITVLVSKNVQIDNPPSVGFISPTNNQTLSNMFTVEIYAADDKGITKVELYIDNNEISEITSYPYTYVLNTANYSNGQHTLKAISYDTQNQTSTSTITISINNTNPPPQDNPPSLNIISPQNNEIVDKMLNITINISDDVGLSKLEVYLNNSLIDTYTSLAVGVNSFQINVANYNNDIYELKIVIYDTTNKNTFATKNIQINNTPSNGGGSNEVISLNTDLNNDITIKDVKDINIIASATNGITKMEIYIKGNLYETIVPETPVNSLDYTYSLDTRNFPEGKQELKIVLYDTQNNTVEKKYNVIIDNFKDKYIVTPNSDGINDTVVFDVNSEVHIYNLKGKLIKTISANPKIWDCLDKNNKKVKPGIYIYKVISEKKILAIGTISVVN